jgi:cell division protein FtsZ
MDDDDEPLFSPGYHPEERRQRGGFLTMFGGRPRKDSGRRVAPARSAGGAQPLELPEEVESEAAAELEIPSFLRRLAN